MTKPFVPDSGLFKRLHVHYEKGKNYLGPNAYGGNRFYLAKIVGVKTKSKCMSRETSSSPMERIPISPSHSKVL